MMMMMMMCGLRFRVYELSCKSVCDLFDYWERAVGTVAASEQPTDVPDDKATKKGKKAAGFYNFILYVIAIFL